MSAISADDTAKHYLWAQGDYEAMSDYLDNVDWQQLLVANLTPDTIWSAFCEILDSAIDLFVPCTDVRPRKNVKTRQYPRHIRKLLSRKLILWRKFKSNRTDAAAKARYKELEADCRDAIRNYEIHRETKVINSGNIGDFYNHVNKRMTSRSKIGTLTTPSGEIVQSDTDKANLLNGYFASVCTQDDGSQPHFTPRVAAGDGINSITFDELKLVAAVRRMKTKRPTSSGPDGYPVTLLRNTVGVLAQPLSDMFTSFMSVSKLPSSWKTAHVTPIYKKGPSSDPANYRPISQTSVFCKLLERVVVADVTSYMMQKGLITKHQHGFINRRSTATNLLESLSDWTLTIDNKSTQTVIYVDFSKAFDSVSRPKLITKLEGYGVSGDLLHLISDFLSQRTQRTRVGSSLSDSVGLSSGIVQGSCLGPLLFLIFINDLAEIFDSSVTPKLYADDVKLYTTIESSCDSDRLQQNIDRLVHWAGTWQLGISIKKCQALNVGTRQRTSELFAEYNIDTNQLPVCDTVVDLGVTVDSELKFSEHIHNMVRKAMTRSYLLSKCFLSRDRTTLVKAFVVYVRPILEYCSSVWSPHLVQDIEAIERVQRRFTKRLRGLWNIGYEQRLQIVGLERLDVRRLRFDLVMTYKITFGLTCLNFDEFFKWSPCDKTRGHDYKFYVSGASCDTRKYFFAVRVVQPWNTLPSDTDFSSLCRFKNFINKLDLIEHCITISQ